MLVCEECRCVSETARGWLAFIAEDPDDGEGRRSRRTDPRADRKLRPADHAAGYDRTFRLPQP